MSNFGPTPEELDKLRMLEQFRQRATVLFGPETPRYEERGNRAFWFRIYGLIDPRKNSEYLTRPDCGWMAAESRRRMVVLIELFNKFGERFHISREGEEDEVGWRVSASILLTTIRLLDNDVTLLEQITQKSKNQTQFMALSGIA